MIMCAQFISFLYFKCLWVPLCHYKLPTYIRGQRSPAISTHPLAWEKCSLCYIAQVLWLQPVPIVYKQIFYSYIVEYLIWLLKPNKTVGVFIPCSKGEFTHRVWSSEKHKLNIFFYTVSCTGRNISHPCRNSYMHMFYLFLDQNALDLHIRKTILNTVSCSRITWWQQG